MTPISRPDLSHSINQAYNSMKKFLIVDPYGESKHVPALTDGIIASIEDGALNVFEIKTTETAITLCEVTGARSPEDYDVSPVPEASAGEYGDEDEDEEGVTSTGQDPADLKNPEIADTAREGMSA